MKEKLLETITKLKEKQIDLRETPAIFRWRYPEFPDVLLELMIAEVTDEEIEEANSLSEAEDPSITKH